MTLNLLTLALPKHMRCNPCSELKAMSCAEGQLPDIADRDLLENQALFLQI